MLQDIHWSECLIGYFPTYAIGNIYAACLREAMLKDAPNAIDELANGRTDTARTWLRETFSNTDVDTRPKRLLKRRPVSRLIRTICALYPRKVCQL